MRRRQLISLLFFAGFLALGFVIGVGWREGTGPAAMADAVGSTSVDLSTVAGEAATPASPEPQVTGSRPIASRKILSQDEVDTIELFQKASPSVAYITSVTYRRSLFSLDVHRIPSGSGSGFIWDDQGHIVTNFHVIQGSSAAQVTLSDQTSWDAEIVGVAPEKDLAVLRIEAPAESLAPIDVGRSSDLLVGQKVLAIGNPFGLDQTLTTGIISALGREIESPARIVIRDVIQTDAAINPGNSGGPLLDSSGRLIGVNVAIYSPSGASAGIGFAIPVDTVNWVVPEIIAKGRIERPTLGIEQVSVQRLLRDSDLEGSLITAIVDGSGADEAGLRGTYRDRRGRVVVGDIITAIDDDPVRSADDLLLALERREVGDVVSVTFIRDLRQERRVKVRLGPASR